jgi:hypothetical protein
MNLHDLFSLFDQMAVNKTKDESGVSVGDFEKMCANLMKTNLTKIFEYKILFLEF